MFTRMTQLALGIVALAAVSFGPQAAEAGNRDKVFFESVAGTWTGPGEIVAGKYKGTKFTCNLAGEPHVSAAGITLDGYCRVGVFKQPMKAVIKSSGRSYKGEFLDGAEGKGLDIVSGNVSGQKMVVAISRQKLNGAMIARLQGKNMLTVTISVKVADQMVPVIGMSLNRESEEISVGSIK